MTQTRKITDTQHIEISDGYGTALIDFEKEPEPFFNEKYECWFQNETIVSLIESLKKTKTLSEETLDKIWILREEYELNEELYPDEEAENFNEVMKREFGVDDFNLAYIYLDSCDDLWDFYLQDERFETTEEQDYAFDLKNELWDIVHNPVFKDHEDFIRGYK